ncbi:MAG: 4Fe-4S ferredoxin [Candidatus Lokiarchaeota archaeon]|nr:4Fe-4S ferredoxin [Candidatus Lokiarchaeota archaeon]
MARPIWFVKLLKKAFPNVKLIAKLTNIPFLNKLFDFLLFKGDNIIYLPKDTVIPIEQNIGKPDNFVLPSQVLEYFIKKANYHWIMNFCICRASMECEDYPINLGCLFLGRGVLDINPKLGKRVSKEEALEHIRKCGEEGLVHMIGKNLLDKQWLGVKDGEKLLSICNCCPCCCLWKISPILDKAIGSKIKKMPGIQVKIDHQKCTLCGNCLNDVCFVNAIHKRGNHIEISEECRGCGRCVEICSQNAINLSLSDESYISKSIAELDNIINVE